jgi:hypothetical protein
MSTESHRKKNCVRGSATGATQTGQVASIPTSEPRPEQSGMNEVFEGFFSVLAWFLSFGSLLKLSTLTKWMHDNTSIRCKCDWVPFPRMYSVARMLRMISRFPELHPVLLDHRKVFNNPALREMPKTDSENQVILRAVKHASGVLRAIGQCRDTSYTDSIYLEECDIRNLTPSLKPIYPRLKSLHIVGQRARNSVMCRLFERAFPVPTLHTLTIDEVEINKDDLRDLTTCFPNIEFLKLVKNKTPLDLGVLSRFKKLVRLIIEHCDMTCKRPVAFNSLMQLSINVLEDGNMDQISCCSFPVLRTLQACSNPCVSLDILLAKFGETAPCLHDIDVAGTIPENGPDPCHLQALILFPALTNLDISGDLSFVRRLLPQAMLNLAKCSSLKHLCLDNIGPFSRTPISVHPIGQLQRLESLEISESAKNSFEFAYDGFVGYNNIMHSPALCDLRIGHLHGDVFNPAALTRLTKLQIVIITGCELVGGGMVHLFNNGFHAREIMLIECNGATDADQDAMNQMEKRCDEMAFNTKQTHGS